MDRSVTKSAIYLLQMESDMALEKKISELRNSNFSYLMTPTERGIIFIGNFGYF